MVNVKKPIVIGIAGQKGAGKNYAATIIRNYAEEMGFTVTELAYADPIKDMLKAGIGLTNEHFATQEAKETELPNLECTPRYLMQTLGTHWGRVMVDMNIWLTLTGERISNSDADIILVIDVRFDNEAQQIRDFKQGHIAQIVPTIRHLREEEDQHESERGIQTCGSDYIVPNPKNANFNRNIISVFNQILTINAIPDESYEVTVNDRVHL